jgi:membrane-associated phospholipid phosphatase
MYSFVEAMDYLGYTGPLIICGMTTYATYLRRPFLVAFIVGLILNVMVNKILKGVFRENRPDNQIPFFDKENNYYSGVEKYGFPSAHSQTAFYGVAYMYMILGRASPFWVLALFIGCVTVYQRIKYNRHTLSQLFFGAAIGSVMAYIVYSSTGEYLKNADDKKYEGSI